MRTSTIAAFELRTRHLQPHLWHSLHSPWCWIGCNVEERWNGFEPLDWNEMATETIFGLRFKIEL